MDTTERVVVFDTTLRDGEQSPGIAYSVSEKVEIAEQLARLGVDVIEAGFPAASEGDFDGVQAISETVKGSGVAALCRTRPEDVDRAWQAIRGAERPRIHTFISTSPVHRDKKLRMTRDQVLAEAARAVAQAAALCPDVEFSAEDATRTELDFLVEIFTTVIANGATTINVPDTVGFVLPQEFVEILDQLRGQVPGADRVTWSVHCHNDLGLATANSLAALRAGARQVEVCVNGIGERAGNAALEEVVMALRTHQPSLALTTGVDSREIARTSRLVSMLSGYPVQPNKAVVGGNAFSHESGIHQHGVLMERTTYEIMNPEDIGLAGNRIVLGKHSGRHAFVDALASLGIRLDSVGLDRAFGRFKELADRKVSLTDADLVALATEESAEEVAGGVWTFEWLAVAGGTDTAPRATVRLTRSEETSEADATGDGMIDAACNAVSKAVGVDARLLAFQVAAVTPGTDAVGDVAVQVEVAGQQVSARGVSTDVVEASARAFLHAINKVVSGTAVRHRTDKP
ncbi:MAG TPA: 2-isopropylmalate synthase [Mycobacteriales bacterium]|nr:2-isopropylmalate synthase [Mycobacteriales bacterium]